MLANIETIKNNPQLLTTQKTYMAENKKSFLLYANITHTVKKLSKDQIADLFLTILDYVNDENPVINDLAVDLVFEPIKQQLKIDLKKWDEKVDKYSNAGREGGIKSGEVRRKKALTIKSGKETEAKRSNASNSERIEPVIDIVNVNDSVNDIIHISGNENLENVIPIQKTFAPPLIEVEEFFWGQVIDRELASEMALKFFNKNEGSGWKDQFHKPLQNWRPWASNFIINYKHGKYTKIDSKISASVGRSFVAD